MKEKIEKLIKEVGINEVETIINQMKSKINVKESLKNDIIKYLSGCSISFDTDDNLYYNKDGTWIFYYLKTANYFAVRYKIWLEFQSKYFLNSQELSVLLEDVLEDVLNYKGVKLMKITVIN